MKENTLKYHEQHFDSSNFKMEFRLASITAENLFHISHRSINMPNCCNIQDG